MAMEMQKKVIGLQQERDGLEERLMRGAPLSLNAEVERRQNLELKVGLAPSSLWPRTWHLSMSLSLSHPPFILFLLFSV